MLPQLHFYLWPAKGQGWEIMKRLPFICACVSLPHFNIYLYISFMKTSSNLQKMIMAVKTSVDKIVLFKKKKHGCHSQFFENHWNILKFKILQLAVSHLHIFVRKACLKVILTLSWKQNGCQITSQISKWVRGSISKATISPLPLVLGVWNEKTTYRIYPPPPFLSTFAKFTFQSFTSLSTASAFAIPGFQTKDAIMIINAMKSAKIWD